jgi:hypothetical protein
MNFIDRFMVKWERFRRNAEPTLEKAREIKSNVMDKVVPAWNYVMKFKKLFLAAPVATMALVMAIINLIKLPALVGLGLQGNGEFSFEIIRELAVIAPLAITAICLLLMFASKRTLTPWMVSLFSLLLPVMILLTNTFPA